MSRTKAIALPFCQTLMEHTIRFQVSSETAALSAFLLENRLVKVQAILPDLSLLRVAIDTGPLTLKPYHVVTLACLLEEYRLACIPIIFELTDCIACQYLESIGFLSQWGHQESHTEPEAPADPASYVLWRVSQERMEEYVYGAYHHYKTLFFADKDLSGLITYLSEAFNNIFDHAFSDVATERIAFAMLQYYPARRRLMFAVSDFGMGIPAAVNRYLERQNLPPVLPQEALQKALELHFSSHSRPHNQGRGLDTLRTGVKALKGNLIILTSHLLYSIGREGKERYQPLSTVDFPGTTVQIRLFYDSLPTEELGVMEDDVTFF